MHAATVRNAIVKHDGECVTERNSKPIIHTMKITEMLEQALETEVLASEAYGELMTLIEAIDDRELYDSIEQIYLTELRSVEEMRLLLL